MGTFLTELHYQPFKPMCHPMAWDGRMHILLQDLVDLLKDDDDK